MKCSYLRRICTCSLTANLLLRNNVYLHAGCIPYVQRRLLFSVQACDSGCCCLYQIHVWLDNKRLRWKDDNLLFHICTFKQEIKHWCPPPPQFSNLIKPMLTSFKLGAGCASRASQHVWLIKHFLVLVRRNQLLLNKISGTPKLDIQYKFATLSCCIHYLCLY